MGFEIGTINIENPVFLAPMSGVTDLPFRCMVKRFGAGLVFSEMIASRPMLEEYKRGRDQISDYAEEFPMAVQIAGCEPDIMSEAAKINAGRGAAIIDINFGCPVKKVVNNFAGSALMKDEALAVQIMEAVVKAVDVPVTVKMRLGWDENSINAPSLAKKAEEVGVKMVTVHGRTRNQLYKGNADWNAVRKVKDAINIPLTVNGDILNADDARRAMEISGADAVMVGRGCYGRPWLIRQIIDGSADPSTSEISALVRDHYDAMLDHYGSHLGMMTARKHIGWYIKDYAGSEELRGRINMMTNPDEVKAALTEFFITLDQPKKLAA